MFSVPVFRTFLAAVLFLAAWSSASAQFGSIADQPSDIMDSIGNWGLPFPNGSVLRAEFPEDLPWDTQISVRGGYDTNVFTDKVDPISSLYTNGTIGLLYKFGAERLQLETDLSAGVTYYFSRPGKKQDYSLDWTVAANYVATARLSFSLNNRISYLSQPDFFLSGTDAQRLGDYWYTSTGIGMTYILKPRLSSVTKYTYNSLTYVEPALNDVYGRIDQIISQSLQYLVFPTTKAIIEVQASPTIYYVADYDTTAFSVLTGFDHQFNPRFVWNFRFGGEARESQNPIRGTETTLNPSVSSDLSWSFSERTSASWNLTYASEPASGTFGASVRQTFRTGLTGTWGLTSRITANGSLYYQHNIYEQEVGADFQEDIFSGTLGLTFQISRNWTVNAVYQYISDTYKDLPTVGYERSIIYAGVNLLF